ncbi:unnamed protein product [Blepharisma stoltei]|uniref:Uncharacterized protein n=1 Tax=Blepharisma stoltei TaxID=1481888 RepID=A0AAU9JTB1_9CILI|nr:unnamed protein product [Blepharisma stoltei]
MIKNEDQNSTPKVRQYFYFFKVLLLLYLGILIVISFGTLHLRSFETSSEVYKSFTNSAYLQLSKLFYFYILIISGYFYTVSVVLRFKDKELRDKTESSLNFISYIGYGLVLFLVGPNITLMSTEDGSKINSLLFNFFAFTIPYVIVLHYSYVEKGFLKDISLSWDSIKYWEWYHQSVVVLVLLGILGSVGYLLYLLYLDNKIIEYAITYIIGIIIVTILFCILKRCYKLQLPKYILGMMILPLTGTQHIFSAIVQGIALGLYTEGICRWGFESFIVRSLRHTHPQGEIWSTKKFSSKFN